MSGVCTVLPHITFIITSRSLLSSLKAIWCRPPFPALSLKSNFSSQWSTSISLKIEQVSQKIKSVYRIWTRIFYRMDFQQKLPDPRSCTNLRNIPSHSSPLASSPRPKFLISIAHSFLISLLTCPLNIKQD